MKTLIISLLFVAVTTVSQAQKVTVLEEVKIGVNALDSKLIGLIKTDDGFVLKLSKYNRLESQEFVKDPIAFMYSHNIDGLVGQLADENYDSYKVTITSNKGYMVANFDGDGKLETTSQRFTDVLLPFELRRKLHKTYKGWTMVKNRYDATTKGKMIDKQTYRVTFQNGKEKQNLIIDGTEKGYSIVNN